MTEMPDNLLAADEPAPVTVHNQNAPSPRFWAKAKRPHAYARFSGHTMIGSSGPNGTTLSVTHTTFANTPLAASKAADLIKPLIPGLA